MKAPVTVKSKLDGRKPQSIELRPSTRNGSAPLHKSQLPPNMPISVTGKQKTKCVKTKLI